MCLIIITVVILVSDTRSVKRFVKCIKLGKIRNDTLPMIKIGVKGPLL